jgi:hypothetical protein
MVDIAKLVRFKKALLPLNSHCESLALIWPYVNLSDACLVCTDLASVAVRTFESGCGRVL